MSSTLPRPGSRPRYRPRPRSRRRLLYGVANQCQRETESDVRRACISVVRFAHHHGMGALAIALYERNLGDPSEDVRRDIAEGVACQPASTLQQVWALVGRLLQDPSEEVRSTMAFQLCNMREIRSSLP